MNPNCPQLRHSVHASLRGERGASLLLVLLVIPSLALVGGAFLKMATIEGDRTRAQAQDSQSLYYAEGGVARAAWALVAKSKLDKVNNSMPAGVTACTANQGGATSGSVNWNGPNVTFTATGSSAAWSRKVQGIFAVSAPTVNLKNVITSPGLIDIKSPNPPTVCSTVNGPVVSGDAATDLSSVLGVHPLTIASVLMLDVPSAITEILATYNETVVTSAQITATSFGSPYAMSGGAGTGVYYTNDPGLWVGNSGGGQKAISVQGECIWCIRGGANLGKEFRFQPVDASAKLLVLIAKDAGGNGLDVEKAADTVALPIVIVSDGTLTFRKECHLSDVAMYGSSIGSANGENFFYDPAVLDALIDDLDSRNLLPKVLGPTTGMVTRLSGSWAELP